MMTIQIITPPVADQTDALEGGLVALTKAIARIAPDEVGGGCLGGPYGYGAHWDNEVFMMRPYCWCERPDCLWCTVWLSNEIECTEEEAEAHRAKQLAEVAEIYGADTDRAPNFWHKRTGLKVHWYKWIGRGTEVSGPDSYDAAAIIAECVASLPLPPASKLARQQKEKTT